jgi:hypothetical protein
VRLGEAEVDLERAVERLDSLDRRNVGVRRKRS